MAIAPNAVVPRKWSLAVAGALLVSLPTTGLVAPAPATAAVPASAPASAATAAPPAVVVAKVQAGQLGHRTLRRGDRGRDVKRLQKLVSVIQTGYFGKLTSAAVRRVEHRYGLKVDSVVDARTLTAIKKHAKAKAERSARAEQVSSRGGSPTAAKRFARTYIRTKYGWDGQQMSCLISMWQRESNWNYRASNPNGRYHGIPQTSSAVWQAHGFTNAQYMGSAEVQVKVGTRYIKGRYGSPCKAWSFWKSHHWY